MTLSSPTPTEIKVFRKCRGLSQAAFSLEIGVSVRAVEDWETMRNPAPPMLRLAMAALAGQARPWTLPLLEKFEISQDGDGFRLRSREPDGFTGHPILEQAFSSRRAAEQAFLQLHMDSMQEWKLLGQKQLRSAN